MSGAHPDVTLVRTELLSIGVDEVRELVRRSAMSPTLGRWQVIVIEDADRITERGADASAEEHRGAGSSNGVDLVCSDRRRCGRDHPIAMSTVDTADAEHPGVARLLETRDGIEPELAAYAARVSQGHIGRARVLARDEGARKRRQQVLQIPFQLHGLGACLAAAAQVVEASTVEAAEATVELDARERSALEEALGFGTKGARPRQAQAAIKELEEQQRARTKRFQRDAIDRTLTELTGFYRDVLSIQTGSGAPLINEDLRPQIAVLARKSTAESTLHRIDALLGCRTALEGNVAPLLAVEAALIALVEG